jgi:hypothetical protein
MQQFLSAIGAVIREDNEFPANARTLRMELLQRERRKIAYLKTDKIADQPNGKR